MEAILRKSRIVFTGFGVCGGQATAELRDIRKTRGGVGFRGGQGGKDGVSSG